MTEEKIQVLRGEGLTKQFRSGDLVVDALRGVDITINQGEAVAIIGPSGSGKSTLMGILGGLDTPTQGSLHVAGVEITDMDENHLADIRNEYIGFVFQQFNLMPTLTAAENVALPIQFSAKKKFNAKRRAAELLSSFGLKDRLKNRPSQLSGGEQQRVAIARALANDPPLLLCDEPTGALDTENGNRVMDTLFQAQKDSHTAVVIVTHDPRVASRADRTLVMTDGKFADSHAA
jgi:ABC-type lipoprotein export system ATPase subunit